jgi:hypothetical protein
MKSDPSVIDCALDVIKPHVDRLDACRQEIADCISMVKFVNAGMTDLPSPAELRGNYNCIAKRMKREINFFKKLPRMQGCHFQYLLPHLEKAAKIATFAAKNTIVPKGSQIWDDAKVVAAVCAHSALKEYGVTPTLTVDGAFYELASILYEGATGKKEQDLTQYCRQLGRVSGRYRMRVRG